MHNKNMVHIRSNIKQKLPMYIFFLFHQKPLAEISMTTNKLLDKFRPGYLEAESYGILKGLKVHNFTERDAFQLT